MDEKAYRAMYGDDYPKKCDEYLSMYVLYPFF